MSVTLRAKELPITLRALAQDEGTRQRDFMVLAIPAYQSISGGSIEQTLGAIQVERTPYEEGGGYRTRSPVILVHDFTGRYWFGVANPEAAPGAGYDFKTVDQVARACDHWLQVIEAERQAQVHEQLNLETREAQRQAAAAALEAQPLPPPGTHLVNEDLGITAELICVAPEGTVYARVLEVVKESDTVYPGRVLAVGQEGRLWGGFHPVAANLGTTMLMPRAPLEVRYGGEAHMGAAIRTESDAAVRRDELQDADSYDVMDYSTGAELAGLATEDLVRASLDAGPEGAVSAYYDGEHWQVVAADEVDAERARGNTVRTVYVMPRAGGA